MAERKPRGYWNYETCKEEARKYSSKKEFEKSAKGAYNAAIKNKWINLFDWFEIKLGKWTYETCREEAKKYKSRTEFQRGCITAYDVARKNKWLNDYDWFETKKKNKGYWNYDTCKEKALKYKTKSSFAEGCKSAYIIAHKNGWISRYDWFEEKKKKNCYWNYDSCKEEAKKYKSRSEFCNGSVRAYNVSLKNGWIEEYDWFEIKIGKWTYETCKEEAKKYKSRTEFGKNCGRAYALSLKNGWIEEYDWFDDIDETYKTQNGHCIYVYVWENEMVAYVGLTHLKQRRHREHQSRESSPVFRYSRDNELTIPEPTYLEDKLSFVEAQDKEKFYLDLYKKKGYYMLNIAPSGSLGGYGKGQWTYETCKEEAKKYKSRSEFNDNCGSAYNVAMRNGWLDDYDWFERPAAYNKIWDHETCKEEAKKYNTLKEFRGKSKGAYLAAMRNGWLDDYDWLEKQKMANGFWNYQNCRKEAMKYKSRNAFRRGNSGAYGVALINKWLDDYDWFDTSKSAKKWNYETCKEEARKYKSRKKFSDGNGSAYDVARKNGWLDDYDWFSEPIKCNYWTYETCKEEARKYKSRSAFCNGSRGAYDVARKNGWLDDYEWFEISKSAKKWNYETCKEEAQKYKSRKEFHDYNGHAYSVARKNGWLDDYDWSKKKK